MRLFLCFLVLAPFSIEAKSLELKKGTRSIFVEQKSGWKLGKDLFGMPFIYFSPSENGQRSNISFTDTGAEIEIDIAALKKDQSTFYENKKKWLDQIGGKALSFFPYVQNKNRAGHTVHTIGVSYEHEGKSYMEKSHYIECRGKLLFSKSLRLKENDQHEKDFTDLVNSVDCGGI